MRLTKTQRIVLCNAGPGPVGIGALAIIMGVAGAQDRAKAKRKGAKRRKGGSDGQVPGTADI